MSVIRKAFGMAGIGLSWGLAWAAVFMDPSNIDEGEGPLDVGRIGLTVGFICGAIFGLLLAVVEHGKSVRDLSLLRVTVWGVVAAAAPPLLTPMNDAIASTTVPLGALCALILVAIARRAARRGSRAGQPAGGLGGLLAGQLRAVCEPEGEPARP